MEGPHTFPSAPFNEGVYESGPESQPIISSRILNDTEVAGLAADTAPAGAKEINQDIDPCPLDAPEEITTQISWEMADMGASDLGAAWPGMTHYPTPPIKSGICDDDSNTSLTVLDPENRTHNPQDCEIIDGEDPEDSAIYYIENGQEHAHGRSRCPRGLAGAAWSAVDWELSINNNADTLMDPSPQSEESLFVPDEIGISQTPETRTLQHQVSPDSEKLNSNTLRVPEISDEAILTPVISWLTANPSEKPYSSAQAGLENSDTRTAGRAGTGSSTKSRKKTPRKKLGPRAKSAKEWFAKRPKDPQEPLPEISGAKRKRSKKNHKSGKPSREKGRKRPKTSVAQKSRKKTPQASKPIRVMNRVFEALRHSDPIGARNALGDLPEEDAIVAKTKGNQFQQIMKGVPKDVNKRSIAADKKRLDEATRSFGYGNCVAEDGKWLIKGMKTPLYSHQVVGASWMLRREFSEEGPWGGILGDEMGMGKTLEALACVVSNMPTDDDRAKCSPVTLIIAPATAIQQWMEEIKKHTKEDYLDEIIHYKYSQCKGMSFKTLKKMDIILASYHEVSKQFPNKKLVSQLRDKYSSTAKFREKYDENTGPLFKIAFWRIILDEAHNIKNKNSHMSIACRNLTGHNRWAMSGTPITNSLDELYPYLLFLKTDWAGDIKDFRYLYGNPEDDASADRLTVIMNILMLRRTMKDSFLGRPLYRIPKGYITVRRVRLTSEERVIYNVVEARFREIINAILEKRRAKGLKTRLRDLEIYIVFLLRLRQGAAHPFLLEPVFKKTLKEGDLHRIKNGLQQAGGKEPMFKRIGKWCNTGIATAADDTIGEDYENSQSSFGNSQFGYDFNMDRQVDIALALKNDDVCRLCYQEPVDACTVECNHIFCRECLNNHLREEELQGNLRPKCPDCNYSLVDYHSISERDGEDLDVNDDMSETMSQRNPFRIQRRGRDSFKRHPKLGKSQSKFLHECDQDYPKPVVPSAKTIAVKEAIVKWQSEAPDDKIIVFMEFKMTGAILGRMLEAEGIQFLYLFGDMTQTAKQNSIRGFHDKKEIKVMLASFRCGSVALNLTCANRVILVDLWWNVAIEMQAFARVFRIGQNKETHFLRIIAQNTIDNRMEVLQAEKSENINQVLEPGERKKLSTEEIAALFGHLKKFDDGSFEVVSDDDEDAELEETEEAELEEAA
ncbi:SNF2 family N-terminal domain-containing protein [Xylaria grammica]|nr:SNF2 family N-terminal domain-containing protein [Xylaria grammica]